MMEQLAFILTWFDAGKAKVAAAFLGLVAVVFVSQRAAVKQHKEKEDEDADRRSRAALDAASDGLRLSPDQQHQRMRDKGWFRD